VTGTLSNKRLRRAQRKLERLKQRGDVAGLVEALERGDWFAPSALLELAGEARAAGSGPGDAVVPILSLVARDPDKRPEVRSRALQVLAETGDERAVAALVALLRDPQTEPAAIHSLRRLGDPRAIEPLLALLDLHSMAVDPADRARFGQVLWTLAGLTNGGPSAVGRLAADHRVDGLTAVALATGASDAQDAALERLQAEAIAALAAMDDGVSVMALRRLWEAELDGLWWRRLVLEALVRRGDREGIDAAARALDQWIGGDRPSDASLSLARVLADTGDERGRRGLVRRLLARLEHAVDCHDRRAAVVELAAFDRSEALVPVESRDLVLNAARDPLHFSSGRVFEDDTLYAEDSEAEEQARTAARELADRIRALERRSQRDLML
jgi:HEAT repeat protein